MSDLKKEFKDLVGGEAPTTTKKPKETMSVPTGEDFIQQLGQAVHFAKKLEKEEANQAKLEEQMRIQMSTADKCGIATSAFVERMKAKINAGDTVKFPYYGALAKQFGSRFTIGYNGYNVLFIEGLDTIVPNEPGLIHEIERRFMSSQGTSKIVPQITVLDVDTGKIDVAHGEHILNEIKSNLSTPKR